jgi:hypothetical protein
LSGLQTHLLTLRQRAATTLLGVVAAFFFGNPVAAQTPDFSLEALRRLQGGANANSPEAMAQRQRLLTTGQAQLAAGQTDAAQQSFDQAALLLHAADTEVALVRTYMQAGDYRRALAFGAHAAGAHREMPAATALYAWLLHLGGQTQVAQRTLAQAPGPAADDATMQWATQHLQASFTATTAAPTPPLLSPSSFGAAVPDNATAVGSALLLGDGEHALVPTRVLSEHALWLRNGLGQTAAASVVQKDLLPGVSLLRLRFAMALPTAVSNSRVPFAGSPGAMVEFMPNEQGQAAWPVLRLGFFARLPAGDAPRALGIDAPAGPRGGPVFDFNGRLVGMALVDDGGSNRLLGIDSLIAVSAVKWPLAAATQTPERVGADSIYEAALRLTLQVLMAR